MDVLDRYDPLVDDPAAFQAACRRPLPTVVRVNPVKATGPQVGAALDAADIGWTRRDWNPRLFELETASPGRTLPHFLGWIHGQEEVSAIPPVVLDPEPGARVWDACAAPGSKTCQLAARLDDAGLVIANDVDLGRLAALRANTERLGLTNVAVTNQDARNFSLEPFAFDRFDAALVDAPCSGEGTVRKQPTVFDDWSESFLEAISEVQTAILRRAVQATRSGGTVVYATCTFAPEENEAVLDRVIETADCRLEEFEVGIDAAPGVTEWNGRSFDPSLRRAKRFYPHLADTGGFFCARLAVDA